MENDITSAVKETTGDRHQGKVLMVLLTGKGDLYRARQALVFARNVSRAGLINDIRFLFFGPAVELLDYDDPESREIRELIQDLRRRNILVSACVSNLRHFDLMEHARRQDVIAEGAAVLISELVTQGFQIITF